MADSRNGFKYLISDPNISVLELWEKRLQAVIENGNFVTSPHGQKFFSDSYKQEEKEKYCERKIKENK